MCTHENTIACYVHPLGKPIILTQMMKEYLHISQTQPYNGGKTHKLYVQL